MIEPACKTYRLQPGHFAQVGIDAGKPILDSITKMLGFTSFFENFIQIMILFIAWLIVVISFFVMATQAGTGRGSAAASAVARTA